MKITKAYLVGLVLPMLLLNKSQGQTSLNVGDVIVTGYISRSTSFDQLMFIPYVDLEDNTEIKITDQSYLPNATSCTLTSQGFLDGAGDDDAVATWTNTTGGDIASGTVIKIYNTTPISTNIGSVSGEFGISANGDQVFLFQGTQPQSSPCNLIFGLTTHDNGSGGWDAGTDCVANASDLPACLNTSSGNLNFATAFGGSEGENGQFNNCPMSGVPTKSQTLNLSNWDFGASSSDFDGTGTFTSCLCSIALPVEWGQFRGSFSESGVVLNWTTLHEENNAGFEIQYSIDGKSWSIVAFVESLGTSNAETRYYYNHLLSGGAVKLINYYRLKQVDYDGHYSYSSVLSVKSSVEREKQLKVYPNPTTGVIHFTAEVQNKEHQVIVYDIVGREVLVQVLSAGNQKIHLDLLPAGVYYLKINGIGSTRIVKR